MVQDQVMVGTRVRVWVGVRDMTGDPVADAVFDWVPDSVTVGDRAPVIVQVRLGVHVGEGGERVTDSVEPSEYPME